MDAEVSKLIASQQRGLEDKIALNIVFKTEGERCERKLEQLEKEAEGHSINWKAKREIKKLKETHAKCCKWLFLCNGASSWMKEDDTGETGDMGSIMESLKQLKEENKKLEDQMNNLIPKPEDANRYHTPKLYPWATLSASAPSQPYIMPVMTLGRGTSSWPRWTNWSGSWRSSGR